VVTVLSLLLNYASSRFLGLGLEVGD